MGYLLFFCCHRRSPFYYCRSSHLCAVQPVLTVANCRRCFLRSFAAEEPIALRLFCLCHGDSVLTGKGRGFFGWVNFSVSWDFCFCTIPFGRGLQGCVSGLSCVFIASFSINGGEGMWTFLEKFGVRDQLFCLERDLTGVLRQVQKGRGSCLMIGCIIPLSMSPYNITCIWMMMFPRRMGGSTLFASRLIIPK